MKTNLKGFIYLFIIVFCLLFLVINSINAQEGELNPIPINEFFEEVLGINIEVILFDESGTVQWGTGELIEDGDPTEEELLNRITKIAKIPREERTPDEWEELLACIMKLYIINGEKVDLLIQKLQSKIQEQDILIQQGKILIEEKKQLIQQLERIINANKEYQDYLLGLIGMYEQKLTEVKNEKKPDVIIINGGLGYTFHLNALSFNLDIGYYHRFNCFGFGGGLSVNDAFGNINLGIWLGLGFYF